HLPIVQQDRSRLTGRSPTRSRHALEAPPSARSSIRAARQRQIAATAPLRDDHTKTRTIECSGISPWRSPLQLKAYDDRA
ncbi:MAG: hypothetical protein WBG92_08590, partial [Thiohalocapsa sp.]